MTIQDYIQVTLPTLEGWATAEKCGRMAEVIAATSPKLAVEIGVFGGRALFLIGLAMREAGGGVAWGIDPWTKESALEGENDPENSDWWAKLDLEEIYSKTLSSIVASKLTRECRVIRERSDVAVKMFDDDSVDFLHLDGNHSEAASTTDVRVWAPKLKQHATLVVDDVDWPSVGAALRRIRELGFRVIHDGGTYQILSRFPDVAPLEVGPVK